MKNYPAIKNIYKKYFKTSDNGPLSGKTNRAQNCIYSMIPNYEKDELRYKLEEHIVR